MATHGPFIHPLTQQERKTTAKRCALSPFPPHLKVTAGWRVPLRRRASSNPTGGWGPLALARSAGPGLPGTPGPLPPLTGADQLSGSQVPIPTASLCFSSVQGQALWLSPRAREHVSNSPQKPLLPGITTRGRMLSWERQWSAPGKTVLQMAPCLSALGSPWEHICEFPVQTEAPDDEALSAPLFRSRAAGHGAQAKPGLCLNL